MKEILVERFQQLAGIKPLYEQSYTEGVYRIFSCQAHFGKDDTELFQRGLREATSPLFQHCSRLFEY